MQTVPSAGLVEGYRCRHGLDIGGELKGLASLDLVRCSECALLFFWPMVSGSQAFYDRLQALDWYYADEKNEFEFARRFLNADVAVLEVGCGKGAFGASLDVRRYVGLEFSEKARARALEAGLAVLGESVQVHAAAHPAQYDVVCSFQVLEHVSAVGDFVRACVACLKPGGVLMFSVPSADSFARDVPNFLLDMPPHHLTRWPDATLTALVRLFELEAVDLWHEPLQPAHRNLYAASRVHAAFAASARCRPSRMGRHGRWSRALAGERGPRLASRTHAGCCRECARHLGDRRVPQARMTRPLLLNIGCGATLHPEWTNLDAAPALPEVLKIDVRGGLPFSDSAADACYSSHVLEHLERTQARRFVAEAFRVLKPGAVLRVVVPDLEGIARHVSARIRKTRWRGSGSANRTDDWMMLELLDQSVRSCAGGEMLRFAGNRNARNREFVISRIGSEGERLFAEAKRGLLSRVVDRVRGRGPAWLARKLRMELCAGAAWLVGGREARLALKEGAFRRSGEIHQWMYDRFSLPRLLQDVGFVEVAVRSAHDSRIAGFARYQLDVVDGKVRKPDSLFVEGVKP